MDLGGPHRPAQPRGTAAGRLPLAVVVVDAEGMVSYWSSGARRLFGVARQDAVGCAAGELLPVAGVLSREGQYGPEGMCAGPGPGDSVSGITARPSAGRARLDEPLRGRIDVLWWAYPLPGPGLLVLAADAAQVEEGGAAGTTAPGFAPGDGFPGCRDLAGRLPGILSDMSVREAAGIASRVHELGCPVLEFPHRDRVPVTPG
ncbi:PAS domain-containing protein [Streptomyces sp. NBC_00859]|uniref:PAS domain-containing protein n=1 Tax=Streptomyces sp. NBC_00859 TaxID=2903682 RepID=UPI003865E22A|nr:PAS domain-containing protein [Streptomyces sp. NBC_00859]